MRNSRCLQGDVWLTHTSYDRSSWGIKAMRTMSHIAPLLSALFVIAATATLCPAADLVRYGEPLGAIWHSGDQREAAADLVEFLRRMSGAKVEVVVAKGRERPATGEPAIVLGELALEMGLPKPPKTISGDGYCLKTQGNLT